MFVIKYDKVSMIKLVSCIEKYPAIYDNTKHYSKDEQDKSWDKVASDVGEKGKSNAIVEIVLNRLRPSRDYYY